MIETFTLTEEIFFQGLVHLERGGVRDCYVQVVSISIQKLADISALFGRQLGRGGIRLGSRSQAAAKPDGMKASMRMRFDQFNMGLRRKNRKIKCVHIAKEVTF